MSRFFSALPALLSRLAKLAIIALCLTAIYIGVHL